jgi:hypothetical protein
MHHQWKWCHQGWGTAFKFLHISDVEDIMDAGFGWKLEAVRKMPYPFSHLKMAHSTEGQPWQPLCL